MGIKQEVRISENFRGVLVEWERSAFLKNQTVQAAVGQLPTPTEISPCNQCIMNPLVKMLKDGTGIKQEWVSIG